MAGNLRVVATAGHVDHGKSSLIQRLTGMDPDRWAEEKRRGLTIDLGYAWAALPSGKEIGFVDVPGHERFVANMLAGVGPVRLVLFVVAADEGWKPQTEEHLQILDLLGVAGGVVALTKHDLVDPERLAQTEREVRSRLAGTALADAPIVPVSAATGEGMDALAVALDDMLATAPASPESRTRLFIDRVFTIKGAGTVVTGTLEGGSLAVGDEVEVLPAGIRARIRSLQTHARAEETAHPVSRVAANLVGIERARVARGDVLSLPGRWRPTRVIETTLRPVRGLSRPITERGAYKLYLGAAEVDARLRIYDDDDGEGPATFARIRVSRPLAAAPGDPIVLRESGRRETVAGGIVLDADPPGRAGADPVARLRARAEAIAGGGDLVGLLVAERGAVRVEDASASTGSGGGALPGGGVLQLGGWLIARDVARSAESRATDWLSTYHEEHPLERGADAAATRRAVAGALREAGAPANQDLVEALLAHLAALGVTEQEAGAVRLAGHRPEPARLARLAPDLERLLASIGGADEATPPTVKELLASGIARDVIESAAESRLIVKISPDLVMTRGFVDRAEALVRAASDGGITVSVFREELGTSRKYAVPLLEWFDRRGITRREGDLRFPRG